MSEEGVGQSDEEIEDESVGKFNQEIKRMIMV